MKFLSILIMGLSLFIGNQSIAQDYDNGLDAGDPTDGDSIPEPVLADYIKATRTPGFSVAYDIVTSD